MGRRDADAVLDQVLDRTADSTLASLDKAVSNALTVIDLHDGLLTGEQYDVLCHADGSDVTRTSDGRWVVDVSLFAGLAIRAGLAQRVVDPSGVEYLRLTSAGKRAARRGPSAARLTLWGRIVRALAARSR